MMQRTASYLSPLWKQGLYVRPNLDRLCILQVPLEKKPTGDTKWVGVENADSNDFVAASMFTTSCSQPTRPIMLTVCLNVEMELT